MEKIKCKCGKDWKIQDNLSAYEGEVVLVCDCGERFYNAQEFFNDHHFINLCHEVVKDETKTLNQIAQEAAKLKDLRTENVKLKGIVNDLEKALRDALRQLEKAINGNVMDGDWIAAELHGRECLGSTQNSKTGGLNEEET